ISSGFRLAPRISSFLQELRFSSSSINEQVREKEVPRRLPKFLRATSVLGTRIFETEGGIDKRLQLPYCVPNFYDFRTSERMLFADKTIYIKYLESHEKIQIHISPATTLWEISISCDVFDLSLIDITGSVSEMKKSFVDYINAVLRDFVMNYSKELGYPQIDQVLITKNATVSLRNILLLVSKCEHTLFVGVDEYDAPANNSAFTDATMTIGLDEATLKHFEKIEQFFKSSFFAVLKEGCGGISNDRGAVISKYFVTGVTPAFRSSMSPLHETVIVSGNPELHGICGFTNEEVTTLVRHYLSKDEQETNKIVNSMRKLYNGYCFGNTAYDKSDPQLPLLYNPQSVFHYIRTFERSGDAVPNEYVNSHILKSIADIGEFSVDDLVQLVISGFVESDIMTGFRYADLLNVGKEKDITCSLLFYLRLLTRGPEEGCLCIPNDIIKKEIFKRIINYLCSLDAISHLMGPAFDELAYGDINAFVKLLEVFLQTRTLRSLQTANKNGLQSIVEILLDKQTMYIPELQLVVDGTKEYGKGRNGFIDIFIPPQATGSMIMQIPGMILELKYITLEGLRSGETENWKRVFDYDILMEFKKKIRKENEQHLLARNYMYWSNKLKKPVLTTVGAVIENAIKQLEMYMNIVAKGESKTYYDFGVLDNRVEIKRGFDDLRGYVIMAIAGDHVLVHFTKLTSTSNRYYSML
ncbi:21575_t:CDS:2, partial [Dentiscutata erythropus]